VHSNSLFANSKGNEHFLYAVLEKDEGVEVVSLRLPIGNQRVLPIVDSVELGASILTLDPTYDATSNLAVLSPGSNLTLVNLTTLEVIDSISYWVGTTTYGKNVIYNHNNKHVIIFKTSFNHGLPYWLSVDEFSVATNKFVKIESSYNCLCERNSSSPFYEVFFATAHCRIDYSSNRIWCSDQQNSRLFSFKADNLSQYTIYSTGNASFTYVYWDFVHRKAYAIEDILGGGYVVHKIDLQTGAVLASREDLTVSIDSSVAKVDPSEPHLYISVLSLSYDSEPTQIVCMNTNSLVARVITLDSSDI